MSAVTFEDLNQLKREILQQTAPSTVADDVVRLQGWKRKLDADNSFGRIFNGPQWLDKVAIRDGNITAAKLEAQLVLASSIIAGAASPADRLEMDATGLKAYGTVSGTPNTQTLSIANNGNFTFGVSPNQITFVASTGVLTVPVAVITSLTIAAVGGGVIGGTYESGASNPKIQLSTAGIRAYNSGGTQTFFLDASNGNWQHVGTYTLASSTSAANRLQMTDSGIELWKSSVREFYLQASGATNAVQMLLSGPSAGQYIGMQPDTGLWLGASSFAAAPFKVSNAGALTATSATITGAITATSGSLSGLTVNGNLTISGGLFRSAATTNRVEMDGTGLYGYDSGGTIRFQLLNNGSGFIGSSSVFSWTSGGVGTINAGAITTGTLNASLITVTNLSATSITTGTLVADRISGGSVGGGFNLGTSDVTVNSTGKLKFGTSAADYLANDILHFEVGGTEAAKIEWKYSGWGSNRPYSQIISSDSTTFASLGGISWYGNGTTTTVYGSVQTQAQSGLGEAFLETTGDNTNFTSLFAQGSSTSTSSRIYAVVHGRQVMDLEYTNRRAVFYGRVYPGPDSGSAQTTRYLDDSGSNIRIATNTLHITGSSGASNAVLKLDNAYTQGSTASWSGNGPGTANIASVGTSYFLIDIGGTLYRVPFWSNS